MMKRRTPAAVLSVLYIISLLLLEGCGINYNEMTGSSANNTAVKTSGTDITGTAAETDKDGRQPVIMVIGIAESVTTEKPGIQDNPVAKEIERVTGCRIEIPAQMNPEIFNTWIASRDLPDILLTNRYYNNQLITSKSVIPLDNLIESYGPHISKLTDLLEFDKTFMSDGSGKTYFLTTAPGDYGFEGIDEGYNIRWDYYKEMGSPAVNNMDDYLNVLAEMQKKYPNNKEGRKVYGLSPYFDWGMWSWTIAGYMFGRVSDNRMMDMDMTNNKLSYLATDVNSSFWLTVETYYKARKKGILDPDSFTQKYDTAIQKNRDLRVLGGWCRFWFADPNKTFQVAGEAKGFIAIPPAKGTKAMWCGWYQPLGSDAHYSISSSCKYPESAMKLIDYLFSEEGTMTVKSGVKGIHWENRSGKPAIMPDTIEQQRKDIGFAASTGIGKYTSGLPGIYNGQYLNLFKTPEVARENQSPLQKQYYADLGVADSKELIKGRVDKFMANSAPLLMQPLVPDDIKRIDDNIINYITMQAPRVVFASTDQEYMQLKNEVIEGITKIPGYNISYRYWTEVFNSVTEYMNQKGLWDIPDYN